MQSPYKLLGHFIGLILWCLLFSSGTFAQDSRAVSFDADWLFKKENLTGADKTTYRDESWRTLHLPHDWSIEDLPVQTPDSIVGPFSKGAIAGRDGGFLVGGTGWYRKHFVLDKRSAGKQTYITFDGVYMNADVWLNGNLLGNHPSGYTSFSYDLTPYLLPPGKANVIAVRVKNEGVNSRWYSGSGIYRHVWLTTLNPLHIDLMGTYVTTPEVSEQQATVSIATTLRNKPGKAPVTVLTRVYSPAGKLAGTDKTVITADSLTSLTQRLTVANPVLWSVDKPALYRVTVQIIQGSQRVDEKTTTFGIRTIRFDAQNGFSLNGKSIKLKGGCIHHDNGPLGAAAIDRAEERKIELLKQQGYNAVRMSHNPPSPGLLDACDQLGMLVIDEAFDMWVKPKTPQDYHLYFKDWWQRDLESMVQRDRNHPSIIMWSIGNEITESADSTGYAIGKQLSDAVRRLDATRPVTMAIPLFITYFNKGKKWEDTAPSFANVDVGGYNYADSKYESDHEKYPSRVMYASEYFPPKGLENWLKVETLPYVIGTFSWTAMDYLGEAGLGAPRLVKQNGQKNTGGSMLGGGGSSLFLNPAWPIFNAYTGELDLIGNKKVNSYYLDVVWKRSAVEVLVHTPVPNGYKEENFFYNFPDQLKSWSFPGAEGKKMPVYVYSRAQKVTLELNGKVVGEQTLSPKSITASFEVPYQPGTLIARSYTEGKETGADTLKTVGKPVGIRLKADRQTLQANRNDLSYISVDVIDAKGNVVPYVDDLTINFHVTGKGMIAGVGNGNPADVSSFQKPQKKVFHGRGLVIVQPTGGAGTITLKAEANGLKAAQIDLTTRSN
ncbi:glycoside hydrolase family 2 TIM barrel-domain containing protein [Spirosoma endophyticum]|uniref:Beta-galactosidase n=1 Tax=Spirosoma endophyticum TaxID=662367 RepID=A0A1I2GVT4_9BACT|nr:glycoside hydrolase family 2 TIM barrel-domain containing protein [Spirosoma endophyticum]SFF20691.1 beta-galactosidase [Spirosoma endophyticum]